VNEWIEELADLAAAGEPVVLVTVAGLRGSAPRESGAKMIVTARETIGTIGGGNLEHECTHIAVGMLAGEEQPVLRRFPLGPAMGQCCGGVVDILFEPMANGLPAWLEHLRALHGQHLPAVLVSGTRAPGKYVVTAQDVFAAGTAVPPAAALATARDVLERREAQVCDTLLYEPVVGSDFHIAVFGAGHVGTALVAALSGLDCNIRWVDSRSGMFRGATRNVRSVETRDPAAEVAAMPPRSFYLVMTHSHPLDFEICDRILRRGDAAYCGLIGSLTKRRRFEKRFRQQGLSPQQIGQLVCPIGVEGISGKKPAEIAISVAADVLRSYQRIASPSREPAGKVRPIRK